MQRIPIVQIGFGGVGRALAQQILQFNQQFSTRYGLQFTYAGLIDRSGAIADASVETVQRALEMKQAGGVLRDLPEAQPPNDWQTLLTATPCLVVDVTARDGMETGLAQAVANGHSVVLANKKPLCASYGLFQVLTERGRTRYEATVGAGLPIISTLRMLLDTGDVVQTIEGCLSGTLGFLMTQLEQGVAFADAVIDARTRGWTEPDPRDDLNGMDVARKALILARTCGIKAELAQVATESLYPPALADIPLDTFVTKLPMLNNEYQERYQAAVPQGMTLRFLARVTPQEQRVGLATVELDSPMGALQGPDNLVVYRTQRYNEQPLRVRGPGAGTTVTASAVLADMLALGRQQR
jgi:homoserine dehydrogenase